MIKNMNLQKGVARDQSLQQQARKQELQIQILKDLIPTLAWCVSLHFQPM